MRSRVSVIVAASALAAVLLSGCTGDPAPVVSTPTFATDDEAFAAAEQTYRNYVDALNQVDLSDPATFEPVYAWTTGDANARARETFSKMHADGWTQTGAIVIDLIRPQPVAQSGNIDLAICLDVSKLEGFDATGASVVSPDRDPVQAIEATFAPASSSSTGFLLSAIDGRTGDPSCVVE